MKSSQDPKAIRREMALTRLKINETINEIGEKVAPGSLESVAKSSLRHARRYVETEAELKLSSATSRLEDLSRSTAAFIRRHPLATSLLGLSLGMLLAHKADRPRLAPQMPVPPQPNTTEMEILVK